MSRIPEWLRTRVTQQAGERCGYCQTQAALIGMPLTIEHLVPTSLGGATTEDNLWLACRPCNEYRGNRMTAPDGVTGVETALFNPRTQTWSEHFAWSEDGTHVLGLSAVGRVTVEALQMNHPYIVKTRRRWAAVGWHPPRPAP